MVWRRRSRGNRLCALTRFLLRVAGVLCSRSLLLALFTCQLLQSHLAVAAGHEALERLHAAELGAEIVPELGAERLALRPKRVELDDLWR